MKNKQPGSPKNRDELKQMSKAALEELVWEQQEMLEKLVEEIERLKGILERDRARNGYRVTAQQKCLAHLKRHFQQIAKLKAPHQVSLAQAFLDLISEAFTQHRQWRETREASAYASWAESFKERIRQTIDAWWNKAGHGARLLLRSLLHKSQQWWYFLDHPEVPSDNNRAERSLRLAVTKRKVSGGSRSFEGMEHSALLLSVIQSCRAQARSVVDFFQQALSLTQRGNSTSLSLIPQLN